MKLKLTIEHYSGRYWFVELGYVVTGRNVHVVDFTNVDIYRNDTELHQKDFRKFIKSIKQSEKEIVFKMFQSKYISK